MSNGQGWKVDSDETLLALFKHAQEVVKEGGTLVFDLVKTDKRTSQQNNALHLYFKYLADDLNSSGYDQLTFPWKQGMRLNWTPESVKEHLWKPVQKVIVKEKATSKLKKEEVDQVYQELSRHLAEKTGVTRDFPSKYLQEGYGDTTNRSKD